MELTLRGVVELQSERDYPMVSIYVPLSAHGTDEAAIRIKNLFRETERRLNLELTPRETDRVMAQLRSQVAGHNLSLGHGSLALFATSTGARTMQLSHRCGEEVMIDDTFATRNLIHALQRMPRCMVVVTDGTALRLFDVVGEGMSEMAATLSISGDLDLGSGARWEGPFAAAADDLLGQCLDRDPMPLFVLAPVPILGSFLKRSAVRAFVIGSHGGDLIKATVDRVRGRVMPLIGERCLEDRRRILQRLIEAREARRIATGIDEVWEVVQTGRAVLVVIEEGFRLPGRIDGGGRLDVVDDPTPPGIVDDVVDEIAELALRHDMELRFTDDGDLTEWGRIAAITRW